MSDASVVSQTKMTVENTGLKHSTSVEFVLELALVYACSVSRHATQLNSMPHGMKNEMRAKIKQ
jgi:hypothetical protein